MNRFARLTFSSGAALLALSCFSVRPAHADLGFWSHWLVGTWSHPTNGDRYRFGSNATYTFTAGAAKRRSGQLSHSGFWKIAQPTAKESPGNHGPVALVLKARSRVVRRGKTRVVLDTRRSFRILVDVGLGLGEDENGEGAGEKHYIIGKARWNRVR